MKIIVKILKALFGFDDFMLNALSVVNEVR